MKQMAFISRHEPTAAQIALAASKGFELVHVGDVDGFDYDAVGRAIGNYVAVAVVNAAAAMNAAVYSYAKGCGCLWIGVFENANRPTVGGISDFAPKSFHVWRASADGSTGVYPHN